MKKVPKRTEIQNSVGEQLITQNETSLFDQWTHIKLIIPKVVPVSGRWVQILTETGGINLNFEDMNNIVELVLCLPGPDEDERQIKIKCGYYESNVDCKT